MRLRARTVRRESAAFGWFYRAGVIIRAPRSTGMTMERSDRIQLPRLKIIHVMLIAGVLAVVFSVLSSRLEDSVIGLTGLFALVYLWFLFTMFRPNPVKAVIANL